MASSATHSHSFNDRDTFPHSSGKKNKNEGSCHFLSYDSDLFVLTLDASASWVLFRDTWYGEVWHHYCRASLPSCRADQPRKAIFSRLHAHERS